MILTPISIDRSHEGRPIAIVEVEMPRQEHKKVAIDLITAIRLNALFFGIIRQSWSKFHEMLIEQAEQSNRQHAVQSERNRELEGMRLAMSGRQAKHIRISDQTSIGLHTPV